MSAVSLRVSAPVCAFRKAYSREYLETERWPPPATVYGFLLALVGEEDRRRYVGAELAIAVTLEPQVSTVLRTAWHVKDKKAPLGAGRNKRPDYQEILTGLEIAVCVAPGPLAERLLAAHERPGGVARFGGLSLGESRDLVDEVEFDPDWRGASGLWLVRDPRGELPLPVWVDHVGSQDTIWVQFRGQRSPLALPPPSDPRWIPIGPRLQNGAP